MYLVRKRTLPAGRLGLACLLACPVACLLKEPEAFLFLYLCERVAPFRPPAAPLWWSSEPTDLLPGPEGRGEPAEMVRTAPLGPCSRDPDGTNAATPSPSGQPHQRVKLDAPAVPLGRASEQETGPRSGKVSVPRQNEVQRRWRHQGPQMARVPCTLTQTFLLPPSLPLGELTPVRGWGLDWSPSGLSLKKYRITVTEAASRRF